LGLGRDHSLSRRGYAPPCAVIGGATQKFTSRLMVRLAPNAEWRDFTRGWANVGSTGMAPALPTAAGSAAQRLGRGGGRPRGRARRAGRGRRLEPAAAQRLVQRHAVGLLGQ